jgi:hypothetical protein
MTASARPDEFRDALQLVRSDAPPVEDAPPHEDSDAPEDVSSAAVAAGVGVRLDDFYAVMPQHSYIFTPSREFWPAASVNARIASVVSGDKSVKAATWLDANRPVEQLTWAPGEAMIIRDRLIGDGGGWIERPGCACFNLYRGPSPGRILGEASSAGPWLDHLRRVYPSPVAEHIERWLAHRVQRPGEKINHALVLGGAQGIGKDSLLEPIRYGVGPWNFVEVSPAQLLGRFNGFVKSVVLRMSEARDLGDTDRFAFYEHIKSYTASPPDVLRCDEKNLREYSVMNVCGVIITTNHLTDGIYLPADDRRHFVAWSDCTREQFPADYWRRLYAWYQAGGIEHVGAYLHALDLSDFDAKAPPPKTAAFWSVVDANRAPEDAELADALERLGRPMATTLTAIASCAENGFGEWIRDRKNSRQIPHRLEAVGYAPVRNDSSSDGRWKIGGKNQVVYAQQLLSIRERLQAVRMFVEAHR